MRKQSISMLLVGLLAIFSGLAPGISSAQSTASTPMPARSTVTLHAFDCGSSAQNPDACLNTPLVGEDISMEGEEIFAAPTDENGTVVFSVPAGEYAITNVGKYTEFDVTCTWSGPRGDGPAEHPFVVEGERPNVECSIYVVTGSANATPTVAPTTPAKTPAPGNGTTPGKPIDSYNVSIVKGDECQPEPTELITKLNPATIMEGNQKGSGAAVTKATSITDIDMSIDELMSGPYSVIVTDIDDTSKEFGCAPIGGIKSQEGGYAFVLGAYSPQSTTAGTVYMEPAGNGTRVMVFITPNRAQN